MNVKLNEQIGPPLSCLYLVNQAAETPVILVGITLSTWLITRCVEGTLPCTNPAEEKDTLCCPPVSWHLTFLNLVFDKVHSQGTEKCSITQ